MPLRPVILLAILALGIAIGTLCGPRLAAAPAHAQAGVAAGPPAPVVACTPSAYTTENEPDPFDQTRIRRTRTVVTSVLMVHADGTNEVHKIAGD